MFLPYFAHGVLNPKSGYFPVVVTNYVHFDIVYIIHLVWSSTKLLVLNPYVAEARQTISPHIEKVRFRQFTSQIEREPGESSFAMMELG